MRGSNRDLPVIFAIPEGTIRQTEWGGMSVELGTCQETIAASARTGAT